MPNTITFSSMAILNNPTARPPAHPASPNIYRFQATAYPQKEVLTRSQKVAKAAYVIFSILSLGALPLVNLCLRAIATRCLLLSAFKNKAEKHELDALRAQILANPNVTQVTLQTPDGIELDGVYLKRSENPEALTIVHFCPNAAGYEECFEGYQTATKECNHLFFNYRGVGASKGKPTPEGLLLDGYTALKFATDENGLNIPQNQIVVHGYSMGGVIGNYAAAQFPRVNCFNERSLATLSKVVEALVGRTVSKLAGKVASAIIKWVNWNYDSSKWWDKIEGEKCIMYSPHDTLIMPQASLFESKNKGGQLDDVYVCTMQNDPTHNNQHTRPWNHTELLAYRWYLGTVEQQLNS